MSKHVVVVGAGLSGAVFARRLVECNHGAHVTVVDSRPHVAGNCHTALHKETGVMQHVYGPHIFHTDNQHVWEWMRRFGKWASFTLRIKASFGGTVYALPINLHTINQYFGKSMGPAAARALISSKCIDYKRDPANFEEVALASVGAELYEAFFKGYTVKQWGRQPHEIPASVLKRLPMRYDYNDNYFNDPYQAIPIKGYTDVFANMLHHPRIEVQLGHLWKPCDQGESPVVYTGPIDGFYGYVHGRLSYRTVFWNHDVHACGDYQGCALVNHPSLSVAHTRTIEHRHFTPWEPVPERTLVSTEFSKETREGDEPFYPVRGVEDMQRFARYKKQAEESRGIAFLGRLGTYRYLDMHVAAAQAIKFADAYGHELLLGNEPPSMPAE